MGQRQYTGSTAQNAGIQVTQEAYFEVFCPAGVWHVALIGVKFPNVCSNLQLEMEICNQKQKLTSTRVVKNYSSSLLLKCFDTVGWVAGRHLFTLFILLLAACHILIYCSSLILPPLNPGVTNFQGHSFKISVTHPLPSIIYSPLHVIHLSCLGSEQPHGLHILSHAPKNIVPLVITP